MLDPRTMPWNYGRHRQTYILHGEPLSGTIGRYKWTNSLVSCQNLFNHSNPPNNKNNVERRKSTPRVNCQQVCENLFSMKCYLASRYLFTNIRTYMKSAVVKAIGTLLWIVNPWLLPLFLHTWACFGISSFVPCVFVCIVHAPNEIMLALVCILHRGKWQTTTMNTRHHQNFHRNLGVVVVAVWDFPSTLILCHCCWIEAIQWIVLLPCCFWLSCSFPNGSCRGVVSVFPFWFLGNLELWEKYTRGWKCPGDLDRSVALSFHGVCSGVFVLCRWITIRVRNCGLGISKRAYIEKCHVCHILVLITSLPPEPQ